MVQRTAFKSQTKVASRTLIRAHLNSFRLGIFRGRQKVRPDRGFGSIETNVAYRPFIGPWLAEAHALEARLSATGIQVIWRRRAWDAQHFPHATRGFFPFWEKIKFVG